MVDGECLYSCKDCGTRIRSYSKPEDPCHYMYCPKCSPEEKPENRETEKANNDQS